MHVKKAMILAAGLGSRLKPWTDLHPKALAVVNGKSLLQRNVEYLQRFGIRDVIVNVHHFPGQLFSAIDSHEGWGSNITISDESDSVLETGGGLKKASWYFNEGHFVLMNVDVLTDMDLQLMINYHLREEPMATIAVTERQTSRYFLFDETNQLCGWRNVKTGEERLSRHVERLIPRAFSGIHVINPSIFSRITHEGKFSMVDVYLELAETYSIKSFDHSSSSFIDVGKPDSVKKAEEMFL